MGKSNSYHIKSEKTREAISAAVLSGEQLEHRRAEVNTAIKTACDYLNSDGVDPRNYVEQLAWMFFLKAFDEAEAVRAEGDGQALSVRGVADLRADRCVGRAVRDEDWATAKPGDADPGD